MSIADTIERKLRAALKPSRLELVDDSHRHAGHAGAREHEAGRQGARASGGETHFRLEVEAQAFKGMSRVARHRLVYDLLKEELSGGVHALALVTRAPGETSL